MQEASKKVALVTGASGFVGSHLARRLLKDGWQVRALVRDPARLKLEGCEIFVGDLNNHQVLASAVAGAEVIFHCAAKVDSWGSRESYWEANVAGTKNLLDAISANNPMLKRLVHISTVDVYGFPEQPAGENSPLLQTGFGYGDSKIEAEKLVRNSKIPHTIIRPCNIIGPGSQFIERIGDQLKSGLMLAISGGRANAGILYIDTLVENLIWAAVDQSSAGQVYNIREKYDVSWSEFLSYFQKLIKTNALIVSLSYRVADLLARAFIIFPWKNEPLLHPLIIRIFGRTCGHSAEKIHQAYRGGININFEEAMQKSITWYQEK